MNLFMAMIASQILMAVKVNFPKVIKKDSHAESCFSTVTVSVTTLFRNSKFVIKIKENSLNIFDKS